LEAGGHGSGGVEIVQTEEGYQISEIRDQEAKRRERLTQRPQRTQSSQRRLRRGDVVALDRKEPTLRKRGWGTLKYIVGGTTRRTQD